MLAKVALVADLLQAIVIQYQVRYGRYGLSPEDGFREDVYLKLVPRQKALLRMRLLLLASFK